MLRNNIRVQIKSSHSNFQGLINPILIRSGMGLSERFRYGVAKIILDYPLTWALKQLEQLNSIERSQTLVATQSDNPIYKDCLASFHLSGVVNSTNERAVLSAIYAAASAQRTYQRQSGLTYMELRVTRLLLKGYDTKNVSEELRISHKTVNAHISNILCKHGYDSRAQYIAVLMGSGMNEPCFEI